MSEKTITDRIIRLLRKEGFFVWKQHGGPMQRAGLPDVFAVRNGHLLAIEVKKPGGKASKLQEKTIRELEAAGAVAFVASGEAEVLARLTRKAHQ